MAERSVSVDIYLDDMNIGSGTIVYVDESEAKSTETVVSRCVSQSLCIDDVCYDSAMQFCYNDVIAKNGGGVIETTLTTDVVFVETGATIGSASIPFVDEYSAVTAPTPPPSPTTPLVPVLTFITLFVSSIAPERKPPKPLFTRAELTAYRESVRLRRGE
jgi:hypothetical protein